MQLGVKQWSIDNYNNLMKRLIKAFNSKIVILGSTNDIICDQIIKSENIINLKDRTTKNGNGYIKIF